MFKLTTESIAKAAERAKAERLKVRALSVVERKYAVTNAKGITYTVEFIVANGLKLAQCDCPARTICKHMAAAASLNIAVQSQREANPTIGEMLAFESRYGYGWMV
jgi:uncharacterized Zn finger protein